MATISQPISFQEVRDGLDNFCIQRVGSKDLGKKVSFEAFEVLMAQKNNKLAAFQDRIRSAMSNEGQISVEDQRALRIYMNSYLASLQLR